MNEVPAVSMHSGKVQNDGGDTPTPGQAHLPPGAWPGVPADSHGWQAEDEPDGIVTGPLPALQKLAARYSEALTSQERIAFLQATFNRRQPLADDDVGWVLAYAAGRAARDGPIQAALESFCLGIAKVADAVASNGDEQAPTA